MAGIYIHIPYCKKKCTYCNFYFKISQKDKKDMLKCIEKEIIERKNQLTNQKVKTIYFGGGTPSILSKDEIKSLLKKIYENYKVIQNPELTIECNPEDLNNIKLESYKKIGINRLSIGVQSFKDDELRFMNRSHNSIKAIKSIKLAQKIGFTNITIDLIYGIPNQTLNDWKKNLNIMFKLGIQHFSAYCLTIEKKTALYNLVKNKKLTVLSDKRIVNQFNLLKKEAKKKGFIHYEISNFAKKGYFSKHNTSYWKNDHYVGVGPSAHSYNGNIRRWNVSSHKKYISNSINNINFFEQETLSLEQHYNEYILTSLRTMWGPSNIVVKNRYGKKAELYFLDEIKKWEKKNYIKKNLTNYALTENGKLFADAIASDLFIIS